MRWSQPPLTTGQSHTTWRQRANSPSSMARCTRWSRRRPWMAPPMTLRPTHRYPAPAALPYRDTATSSARNAQPCWDVTSLHVTRAVGGRSPVRSHSAVRSGGPSYRLRWIPFANVLAGADPADWTAKGRPWKPSAISLARMAMYVRLDSRRNARRVPTRNEGRCPMQLGKR